MNRNRPRRAPLKWIALGIAAVAGLWVLWHKEVRDHVVPRNFGVVQEGELYRSGRLTPRATRLVAERHDIKTIIDLGAYDKHPERDEIAQRTAEALGVTRYVFNLEGDGTGNPNAYVAALRILTDPANHPVLVHCAAGSERTSACTMLYLKLIHDKPFVDTYPLMMNHKHRPEKNPRLMSFLADHADEILDAYRGGGFIPGFAPLELIPAVSRYAQERDGAARAEERSPDPAPHAEPDGLAHAPSPAASTATGTPPPTPQ